MEYEDRLTLPTPEGVDLELSLAGLGSRFIAFGFDMVLKLLVLGALALALLGAGAALGAGGGGEEEGGPAALGIAVFVVAIFLLTFGYDVLFETRAAGRTPGKRWTGLRVVRLDGRPVDLRTSAVRNVVRALEGLPTGYLPAMASVLATRRNQRLGDLAAGTLVVRERRVGGRPGAASGPVEPEEEAPAWDVSTVTPEEVATVRRFLERRESLTSESRHRIAGELADRLRAKVAGPPPDLRSEPFLERLVASKDARR